MRYIHVAFLALVALSCCLIGCGPKKPAGIPKLVPATITVVRESAPVANANVFLVAQEGTPTGSWSTVGLSDAKGVAVLQTTQGAWNSNGVPEGEYKVYFTKIPKIEEPELPADVETNPESKANYLAERQARLDAAVNEIPKNLTSNDTSEITVTVSSSGLNERIDVAEYDE